MKHRCKDTKNWAKKRNNIKKRLKKDIEQGFRQNEETFWRYSVTVATVEIIVTKNQKFSLFVFIHI